jgi:hypothetical protein
MSTQSGSRVIEMEEAFGDPATGYFIKTPVVKGRVWPRWSLRYHMSGYLVLCDRFDNGYQEVTFGHMQELRRFMRDTHTQVAPHVFAIVVEHEGARFFPAVMVEPGYGEHGWVSRWLDSLKQTDRLVFPEVVDAKLCEMLHRRGFQMRAVSDDDADANHWLPCHVRGFMDA